MKTLIQKAIRDKVKFSIHTIDTELRVYVEAAIELSGEIFLARILRTQPIAEFPATYFSLAIRYSAVTSFMAEQEWLHAVNGLRPPGPESPHLLALVPPVVEPPPLAG